MITNDSVVPEKINLLRLTKNLLFSLVLPVLLALSIDLYLGTMPWLTIVASIVFIPLGSLFVGRAALSEFERVLHIVAPEDEVAAVD